MRRALIERKTQETAIRAVLNIDGQGQYKVSTGIRFFDHMLELLPATAGSILNCGRKATSTWTSTTLWKTSASFWVRPFTRRWDRSAAFCAPDIL